MNSRVIIDSHCHVVKEYFADEQELVIERAFASGVKQLVNPGVTLADIDEVTQLTERYEQLFGAVGIHPHDAKTWSDESEKKIRAAAGRKKIVAIGECGWIFTTNTATSKHKKRSSLTR